MRHLIVLALVVGTAGWAATLASADSGAGCATNTGVTAIGSGITIANGVMTVPFVVASGCNVQLSLVSYEAPGLTFDEQTASQQVKYGWTTQSFGAGNYSLSVPIPSCYYQVDLVYGTPIDQLGPAGTNNFYGKQGRLIADLHGGKTSCQSGESGGGGGEATYITICHATGNGYTQLTASDEDVLSDHLHHDSADIIPPFTVNGTTYSQNWDTQGQATYANGCEAVSQSGGGETQTPPPTQTQTPPPPVVHTQTPTAAPPAVPLPSITLVKYERVGSTGDFVRGPVDAKVGDTVEYRLVVTNTGTTDVSVNLRDVGCTTLSPAGPQGVRAGTSVTFTCSHVVTTADGASYTNIATATANNAGPVTVAVQSTVTATIGATTTPNTSVGGVKAAHKTVKHKAVHHKVKKVTKKAKAAHAVRARAHVTG